MAELLFAKINEIVALSEEEYSFLRTLFVSKKLHKKQFLLQEGAVCTYQAFVEKGILRSYMTDDKNNEHILQFASEGWWMADLSSFLTGTPSRFSIQALEETEVLLIDKPSWNLSMENIPGLEHYFRILIQNHLIATQERLMQSLSESAEKKFLKFEKTYPSCVTRVPQHMIASYLGITRETLSRVRKQLQKVK